MLKPHAAEGRVQNGFIALKGKDFDVVALVT